MISRSNQDLILLYVMLKLQQFLDVSHVDALKRLLWITVLVSGSQALLMWVVYTTAIQPNATSQNWRFGLFILLLILFSVVSRRLYRMLSHWIEDRIVEIRHGCIEHIVQTDLRSFETLPHDVIYTALTFDIHAISELSHLLAMTIEVCINTVLIVGVIAILSLPAAIIVVSLSAIVGYMYVHDQLTFKQTIQQVRQQEQALLEAMKLLVTGRKELHLNAAKHTQFFDRRIATACQRLRDLKIAASNQLNVNATIAYGVLKGLIVGILFVLPLFGLVSQNKLLIFVGILTFLPVSFLIEQIPSFFIASASVQRLYRSRSALQQLPKEPENILSQSPPLAAAFQELSYHDLHFQYNHAEEPAFAIGPFSCSLRQGEILFITGGNGSGKTTLLKLLVGLYETDAGQVRLNGQLVDIRQHRNLFAAVFNDSHLFDRLYGLPQVDAERVRHLLELMRLERKVQYVNGRFTTLDLSTGQKKRLALVCAMLEDRPIYVFDEWAAGQDPQFRHYFYDTLLPSFAAEGKTVIAITHDDRWFHVADRVLKMEYGKALEP